MIFLSFKDVGGECFEDAYGLLQSVISQLYVEHTYLEESMEIDESYKDISGRLKRRQGNKADVPMAKAGSKGYYNEMLDVIGTMMSQALKDNTALKFSVITGCLRISKESIFTGTSLFIALWNEDSERLSELISDVLFETISYHDYAESFYHAFLAGLFANAGYIVESNYESGLGRPDLVIKDKKKRQAVVIEIKIADGMRRLQKSAEKALDQIEDMRYADGISAQGYQKVIKYGAAFY